MEELFNLGILQETINIMKEVNPEINDLSSSEILAKTDLLKQMHCDDSQIVEIISCNPIFLSRTNTEVTILLSYLIKRGFTTINLLLDSNPFILNLEPFEIDNYINKRNRNGETIDEIVDDLDSNPYLFNEV